MALYAAGDADAFDTLVEHVRAGRNEQPRRLEVAHAMGDDDRDCRQKPDEVEAVLGHEIGHVANGDMVTQTLLQGVLNTFVFFFARVIGMFIDGLFRNNDNNSNSMGVGYYIGSMIAELLLGFLATMIVMWFSRHREFKADIAGADLAGRQKMINALRRLQGGHATQDLPGEMAAFGIAGEDFRDGLRKLFMTHPPLEERIAALEAAR